VLPTQWLRFSQLAAHVPTTLVLTCFAFSLSENTIHFFQRETLNVTPLNVPYYAGLKLSYLQVQAMFDGKTYLSGAKLTYNGF
jgi:folate-dependent phosphoribosylglycinamide formyltransferase PurN